MDMDGLNRWLSLVANFAVIAGIVLLAWEVSQNQESLEQANAIARNEALLGAVQQANDFRMDLAKDAALSEMYGRGIRDPDSLEQDERERFYDICSSQLWMLVYLHEAEKMTRSTANSGFTATARQAKNGLETPGLKDCWSSEFDYMKEVGFNDFVEAIQAD
jgi:hypothetical protein